MMGYQIAITGFVIAASMLFFDIARERATGKKAGDSYKTFGGFCITAIPIGLIIQVWI